MGVGEEAGTAHILQEKRNWGLNLNGHLSYRFYTWSGRDMSYLLNVMTYYSICYLNLNIDLNVVFKV